MSSLLKTRKAMLVLWILLCLILMSVPALAGSGDGTGGGKNIPLALVSCDPYDGQKDVTPPVQINLKFNKNVINMKVKDNNLQCFSLWVDGVKQVPVEVRMADDQVQPELKRDIVLVPLKKLESGKGYTVKILGTLCAKSGATLGTDVKISFQTAAAKENLGSKSSVGDNSVKKSGTNTVTKVSETSSKDPEDSSQEAGKQDAVKQETKQTEKTDTINSNQAGSSIPENSVNQSETVKKQVSDQGNTGTTVENNKQTGILILLAAAVVIGICWQIVKIMRKRQ